VPFDVAEAADPEMIAALKKSAEALNVRMPKDFRKYVEGSGANIDFQAVTTTVDQVDAKLAQW
jgi:hypothetical protein